MGIPDPSSIHPRSILDPSSIHPRSIMGPSSIHPRSILDPSSIHPRSIPDPRSKILNKHPESKIEKFKFQKSIRIEKCGLCAILPYKSRSAHPCLVGRIKFYLLNMGVPTSIYKVKYTQILMFQKILCLFFK